MGKIKAVVAVIDSRGSAGAGGAPLFCSALIWYEIFQDPSYERVDPGWLSQHHIAHVLWSTSLDNQRAAIQCVFHAVTSLQSLGCYKASGFEASPVIMYRLKFWLLAKSAYHRIYVYIYEKCMELVQI